MFSQGIGNGGTEGVFSGAPACSAWGVSLSTSLLWSAVSALAVEAVREESGCRGLSGAMIFVSSVESASGLGRVSCGSSSRGSSVRNEDPSASGSASRVSSIF